MKNEEVGEACSMYGGEESLITFWWGIWWKEATWKTQA